jgi:DNA-binding winged helix-turn-helix (wHTH) protein
MLGNGTGTLRFGPFVIERSSRELRKNGTRIRLPKQSLEILVALLEQPGQVVSREEVIGRLWPHGTVVEYEHSIHAAVRRVREALGDTAAKPKFIETIPGIGYRYVGPAIDAGPAPEMPARTRGYRLQGEVGRGSALPIGQVLDISIQTADALSAAHAAGVIHRDIKPENIFITGQGRIKLLDFGIAKRSEIAGGNHPESSLRPTESGQMLGTVEYMSPEQVRGEELDCRTDLFSFGAVLYEMATGRKAFAGSTNGVIQEAILNHAVEPRDLPQRLMATIEKALQKDRSTRYQSASAIRDDLEQLKQQPRPRRRSIRCVDRRDGF